MLKERLHVHNQIFDDAQAVQRLDGDGRAGVANEQLAGQLVAAVDAHGIRAAHAVRARAAQIEGSILEPLDLFQYIEHAVGRFRLYFVVAPPRLAVAFGVEAFNFDLYFHFGLGCYAGCRWRC